MGTNNVKLFLKSDVLFVALTTDSFVAPDDVMILNTQASSLIHTESQILLLLILEMTVLFLRNLCKGIFKRGYLAVRKFICSQTKE